MKLKTRLLTAFLLIIFFPSILFGISSLQIVRYQVSTIQKEYGIKVNSFDVLSNPLQILNRFTRGTYNKISYTLKESPENFENLEYIEELNQGLKHSFSYLILRKEDDIIYSGNRNNQDIEPLLPAFGEFNTDIEGGFYIDASNPFLLKQKDFYFSDKSQGSIFIITDVKNILPQLKNSARQMFFAYILIAVLTAILLVYWIYFSIIRPLNTLKKATGEIKEGNLEYSIKGDPKDEIGQLCIDFEEMRIRLKDLIENQIKSEENRKELFGNISHDLKTPITAIKGYAEGIMDGVADTPEKKEKYIKTIYNKANSMSALVDELLLYSKIDGNNMAYHFSRININDFFEDCIGEVSLDLEVKNTKITYHNEVDKSTTILADPIQLKKVINNIIINGVKYIEKPKATIDINIKDLDKDILISIKDNGEGIHKKDIPYVFERFYRSDESRNSMKGGTGLGLSIAKKIVEDHKGQIWLDSEVGKGTTVSKRLKKYQGEEK